MSTSLKQPSANTFDASPRAWLLLVLLAVGVWVPFLGSRDLWYPDEPDIAEVCKAMYVSGDWVAPRRNGEIWVDYPPMIYWAGTVSAHLFGGMSEFTLRLPNALASIALMLLVYFAGVRWFGRRAGFWAGFAMLTFLAVTYESVSYRPDTFFSLAIGAGMFAYARGVEDRLRWGPRVLGFVLLGLAMLSKGPLGLLLPGLILTLWHGSRREWRRILELAPLAVISVAIYLAWFVPCARAMGADDILYELYAQNFARFGSGSRGHDQPFYYYFIKLPANLLPWGPLLPFVLLWIYRSRIWCDKKMQLLLWWLGTFFVFLSLAATKRSLYMLPAFPAAALIFSPWLARVGLGERTDPANPGTRALRVYSFALASGYVLLGVLCMAPLAFFERLVDRIEPDALTTVVMGDLRFPLAGMGLVFLAGGAWIARAAWRDASRALLIRFGAVQLVLYIVTFAWVLPAFEPIKTYRPQGEWIRQQIGDEREIGLVNPGWVTKKMGAFGYYSGTLIRGMETLEEIETFLREHPASVVLVETRWGESHFATDAALWRKRILRDDLQTGSHHYTVVRGP